MSRNALAIVSSILFAGLAAALVLIPAPYVAWRPGETLDVLGTTNQGPVIEVTGLPTTDPTGQLLMTTVSTTRVDSSISLPEAIYAYLDPSSDAMPREVIYPPGRSTEEVQSQAVEMMDTSRSNAIVAALRADGVKATEMPQVGSVTVDGPSDDKLKPGDLISAVDNIAVSTSEEVGTQIATHDVGDAVVFTVLRDGTQMTVSVTTVASPSDTQKPIVGITLTTGYRYDPTVTFNVDPSVTGPSAGLVFALGIYDRITDGQLVGDRTVAATGTMDANGGVGAIGGIREKIKGAERDGAETFLLPKANCGDIGDLPTKLRLVPVLTLKDAISALQLINEGKTSEVPTCG